MRSLLMVLIAFASPGWAQVPPRIPVEHFAESPSLDNLSLSPSGRKIAAISMDDQQTTLVLFDADNPEGPSRSYDLAKMKVSATHWAGEGRLLIEVITSSKFYGISLPISRMIVLDVTTGRSWIADGRSRGIYGGDVLFTDLAGSYALVASQDDYLSAPSVKRVDLATGKATVVEKARRGVWDWFVDDQGVVRGGVSYDDKRWKLWYRAQAGEPLQILQGKLAKDEDGTVDRIYFGKDGVSAAIITNERNGRFGVYRYDLKHGEVGEPLFEHAEVDVTDALIDPATQAIAAVRYHDDRWRTNWLDPALGKLQQRLDKALPANDNKILSHPGQRDRVLIWSGGAADPGSYFLLDRKSSTMKAVATPRQHINPAHLASVRPVRYRARDGLEIRAYLTLPVGREAKALPLILLPHGGPFARDEWTYDPYVQMLANRGYAVLQPQFRGSTGFGKDFVVRGYGEWGRKMQDDLDDGVDWLASTGQIDPKRVCIVGASYGGYAALWGVIRNPERYRCAASFAGVTDIGHQLRDNRRTLSAVRYFRAWREKVVGEAEFDLKSVSPLAQASRLHRPVLIAHGEADDVVLVRQARDLVAQLQRNKAAATAVFYKESGHNPTEKDLADFLRRLETFLAEHNPA